MKCLTEPSDEPKRLLGTSGSGACALCVRSGTIVKTAWSVFLTSRPGSPAGPPMTFSLVKSRRKPSAAAMCSITCATDQRSGAGLKFHCSSDRPLVASRTFFFVDSRYCSARSFSAWVTSCADAAAASDVRGSGGVRTGSDPGGKGPRTAIPGIDKEKCSGSDQRPVRGAVELQTGAGSLVRGASDRTHRGGGGFSPGLHQGKSHGRAGGGTRAGRQED